MEKKKRGWTGLMVKKYSVGTKIKTKHLCCKLGSGKEGKIVKIVRGFPVLFVPECDCVSQYSTSQCPASVQTSWYNLEKLVQKGEQLLFSFMD